MQFLYLFIDFLYIQTIKNNLIFIKIEKIITKN